MPIVSISMDRLLCSLLIVPEGARSGGPYQLVSHLPIRYKPPATAYHSNLKKLSSPRPKIRSNNP
jgi:hypothetical protein